jgi:hypothetical protein
MTKKLEKLLRECDEKDPKIQSNADPAALAILPDILVPLTNDY